jgi:hypothetical protein
MQGSHRRQSRREIGGGGFIVNATNTLTMTFTPSLGRGRDSPIAKGGRLGECPRRIRAAHSARQIPDTANSDGLSRADEPIVREYVPSTSLQGTGQFALVTKDYV